MRFYRWLVRKLCEILGNYCWLVRDLREIIDNYSWLVRKLREILDNYTWWALLAGVACRGPVFWIWTGRLGWSFLITICFQKLPGTLSGDPGAFANPFGMGFA